MRIDLAMLWDMLNIDYPDLETTLYGEQSIRGIKLYPEDKKTEKDFLYIGNHESGLLLCYNDTTSLLETGLRLDELFNSLQDAFNRLRDWDMETHLALIEGCESQKLLELSEGVLGNPITLMDPSYRLLAHTSHENTQSAIFNEVCRCGYLPADTVEFYRLRGYLNELVHSGEDWACLLHDSGITAICPLRVNKTLVGFLTMPCILRAYSQGIAECFQYLAECVTLCMKRQLHSSDISRYMYEYLLIDLLEGNLHDDDALAERLKYIALPRQGDFSLLVLSPIQDYATLGNYIARQLSEQLPNERVFLYQDQVLILLPSKRFDWVYSTIAPFLKEHGLCCGVSRRFERLGGIVQAYRQAQAALRLGQRIGTLCTLEKLGVEGLHYENSLFHYQHYSSYHMVESAANENLISPLICQLAQLDRREGTDHIRVLYGFLSCERRFTQTAALLHMHRNNVIYRIDRIQNILNISLNDPILRAELQTSFLVVELVESSNIQQNAQ